VVALFLAGSLHLERAALWAMTAAFAGNVALNLVAIPRWGAVGAGATTLVTETALTGWLLHLITARIRTVRQPHHRLAVEEAVAANASAA
jgi:O-antigen/teichoic acid export membrane protein